MSRIGTRIHLSISKDVKQDISKRKDFNASKFFETKYREEFMNKQAIRARITKYKEELREMQDRLMSMTNVEVATPELSSNRCQICTMFFSEDIAIRKKIHVHGSLYVCAQCKQENAIYIQKLVDEMKAKEKPE